MKRCQNPNCDRVVSDSVFWCCVSCENADACHYAPMHTEYCNDRHAKFEVELGPGYAACFPHQKERHEPTLRRALVIPPGEDDQLIGTDILVMPVPPMSKDAAPESGGGSADERSIDMSIDKHSATGCLGITEVTVKDIPQPTRFDSSVWAEFFVELMAQLNQCAPFEALRCEFSSRKQASQAQKNLTRRAKQDHGDDFVSFSTRTEDGKGIVYVQKGPSFEWEAEKSREQANGK